MKSVGTIVALSSGVPPSAIAIVRASGPEAVAVARAFAIDGLRPRRAAVRDVRSPLDDSVLDKAVCLLFPGPGSATGEDVLELHLHGGPALVERVLSDALTVPGVRAAEPGEFTLRAVLNGRMGLADAEGLADLIEARTESERRRATRLADGALSRQVADWRARLIGTLALCEAYLDFSDEGDVGDASPEIDPALNGLREEIEGALLGSDQADRLSDGFHVAFVGPPNAGKSSLLNALAGRDVAIVSDEAGTTRDVVSVSLELGGYRVILHDTAGIRDGASGIEALGIARTEATRDRADFVVEVRSPDTNPLRVAGVGIVVGHKCDLGRVDGTEIETTCSDAASIATLKEKIAAQAAAGLARSEAALITRARQRSALLGVVEGIDDALDSHALEVKAEGLRLACQAMARMTGEIGIEDVLDDVFGRFCLGK
ncbi:tRNA uridine-5-carboxymethylaminomethyl(34) synthesis GTPase MnmE [Acuticoccus sp. M5D2P5]|uniref:tRNA uridine-5-carboxymethylaminomethyl(34) synthesis GTPase MnmE n=1 Tax=Acuticoccus kalidii TaxID=2910977 RepID=UPI001F3DC87E|nr:tRNA uridine-5-carboxymethylaminomethyl(34) synthesis GTPase MnmE [Acuticoccus kalidii]MCF3933983.1 tRNA uridine-5-carboxymethylaminomethyl(34) synthesis GTPase MnmE [Acuticoccus kalidii]